MRGCLLISWVPGLCSPQRLWANTLRIGGVFGVGGRREIASGGWRYFTVVVAFVTFHEQNDSASDSSQCYHPSYSSDNGSCGYAALLFTPADGWRWWQALLDGSVHTCIHEG
jgi:hypothetical protein